MKILVTGASGYVGRQLTAKLVQAGHEVTCMVRNGSAASLRTGAFARIVAADALRAVTILRKPSDAIIPTWCDAQNQNRCCGHSRVRGACENVALMPTGFPLNF